MRVVYFGRGGPRAACRSQKGGVVFPTFRGPDSRPGVSGGSGGRRAGLVNFLHAAGQLPPGGSLDYKETGSGAAASWTGD
ncbi:hypothetical protein EYF80_060139 [Liparis tanakae]|uniref:Uncharacterized protein n=1 Tax=Liparis tanakae TaxID=230148 RepID=A0A4Z2EMV9_9TELE|nr:hypothetical protein EYF80_060139 [Liparis tanakae]